MAGRIGAQLMAIVTEGKNGRSYYAPTPEHEHISAQAQPEWRPLRDMPDDPCNVWCKIYGFYEFADLFTARQLVALTTFSDLVAEVSEQIHADALAANLLDDKRPLRENGRGAHAYADAISVYLAFTIDRSSDYWSNIASWAPHGEYLNHVFMRQAIPMIWDFAEGNPYCLPQSLDSGD